MAKPDSAAAGFAPGGPGESAEPSAGACDPSLARSVDRGVVYIATGGNPFFEECRKSVISLRSQRYHGPVLVFTDSPRAFSDGASAPGVEVRMVPVLGASSLQAARKLKCSLFSHSPFQRTLYLDTDTEALGDIRGVWERLGESPVAFASDVYPTLAHVLRVDVLNGSYCLAEARHTRRLCPPTAAQPNGGVMLFRRCPDARRLFESWAAEWSIFQGRDQLALMRAIALTKVPVAELGREYNEHDAAAVGDGRTVIYHYWPSHAARRPSIGTVPPGAPSRPWGAPAVGPFIRRQCRRALRVVLRLPGGSRALKALIPHGIRHRLKRLLPEVDSRAHAIRMSVLRSELADEILESEG